jgi:hypothetical protein
MQRGGNNQGRVALPFRWRAWCLVSFGLGSNGWVITILSGKKQYSIYLRDFSYVPCPGFLKVGPDQPHGAERAHGPLEDPRE